MVSRLLDTSERPRKLKLKGLYQMTTKTTTTNAVPTRLSAEHYEMKSETQNRTYDLTFVSNEAKPRWSCNCPDVRYNGNDNCKHVRRLRGWIAEQMSSSQVQQQATAIVAADAPAIDELAELRSLVAAQGEQIAELSARFTQYIGYAEAEHRATVETFASIDTEIVRLQAKIAANSQAAAAIQELTQVVREAATAMTAKQHYLSPRQGGTAKAAKAVEQPLTAEELSDKAAWEAYEKIALEHSNAAARTWKLTGQLPTSAPTSQAPETEDADKRHNAPLHGNKPFNLFR